MASVYDSIQRAGYRGGESEWHGDPAVWRSAPIGVHASLLPDPDRREQQRVIVVAHPNRMMIRAATTANPSTCLVVVQGQAQWNCGGLRTTRFLTPIPFLSVLILVPLVRMVLSMPTTASMRLITTDDKVYVYNSSGQPVSGENFNLDSSNSDPSGITYANNRFYVVDADR